MPVIPSRIQDQLDFFDQHAPVWAANAAALGLTPAQTAAFTTAAAAARTQYTAQLAALEAARIATVTMQAQVHTARAQAADLIRTIKAFAENSAKPAAVYNLAQIPQPQQGSPLPPPGQPTGITATLLTDGAIRLGWKAHNPAGSTGTLYNIRRKVEGETAFTFVGVVGTRTFTDATLPPGPASVQYVIYGQRGTTVGQPSSPFTVLFGSSAGGLTIESQFEGPTRLAA